MKKNIMKKLLAGVLAVCCVVPASMSHVSAAGVAAEDYVIYPAPHEMTYQDGSYILTNINVIYDEAIDDATKARLEETASLKNLSVSRSDQAVGGMTNVYVGVYGSADDVDDTIVGNYNLSDTDFEKTDSYFLASDNNVISVLGKDTDASFYGLTTLYHVFAQLDSLRIQNFTVKDYADVVSRGFIEGYYGNPWSTENRIDLMKWGGYYKLNSYFYAPKDDPKHNAKWRELYTDEEIETKIKPLAEAGNESKCRFVFALHPYMNNAIRYNTEENYQADLKVMQDKFAQVIEAGVRQIAILADDAGNVGGDNYIRTLEDMTAWLKEMQKTYPDLKLTLPFCTQEYMGWGESYYQNFPENVQIVMTGGRVWGEVSNNFTDAFTANAGRGPYMWVNWPCSDNSKQHLIMGGYDTFLHPGLDSSKIQGIVLNPMQQSEPSKVAIFGNAAYSWNIWETKEEADQAWDASFSFVDHNSAVPNEASDALKELSKHMINQNMDSRVTVLQESVELKEKLTPFREKLDAGTVTEADVDEIIAEFEKLQEAAAAYRQSAGDTKVRDQIVYWLDCWDDTTEAAIAYLNGVKSAVNGDITSVINYNTAGKTAFDRSKTHGFHYVDHTEYAEVGVQHIVPFIEALAQYVSASAETGIDPDKVIAKFITSRTDAPVGSTDNAFDGDDSTQVSYRNPVWIYEGDYVGVKYNRVIPVNDIRFLLGNGKNHIEHAKLEYTTDGESWQDIELIGMENNFEGVRNEYQEVVVNKENLPENFEAMGIRLTATANNTLDAYFNIHEIQINKTEAEEPAETERLTGEVTYSGISVQSGTSDKYFDGDASSEVWLAKGEYSGEDRDTVPAGAYIQITFDAPKAVGSLTFSQGASAAGDVFADAAVQYQVDGSSDWVDAGAITNAKEQTVAFTNASDVTAVRILNNAQTAGWVRVGEIDIREAQGDGAPISYTIMRTDRWTVYSNYVEANLYDGNDDTFVWYDPDGPGNTTEDDFMVDDFLGYDLGKVAELESAHIVVGNDNDNKIVKYAIETSVDNIDWTAVEGYDNYTGVTSGKDVLDIELNGLKARYIRIRNLEQRGAWGKFSEFTVQERVAPTGSKDNVYTDAENVDVYSMASEGVVSLVPATVTLPEERGVGIDLKNIKAIEEIAAEFGSDSDLKLQISKNSVIWEDVEPGAQTDKDARYIRIYNSGNSGKEVNIASLEVSYSVIGEISVESDLGIVDSSRDMRKKGNVADVFDGDLTTYGEITSSQKAGGKIIFDLGQTRDISSIRYYISEANKDFLRYAKFEVANDPEAADDSWQEVLVVGNPGVDNTSNETTAKDSGYLVHDSQNPGNMYAENTGLTASGRYLRVVLLETYSYRWMQFNEIQINGGEYVTTEADRDVVADCVEEPGKVPSNMFDGDYRTTYKPSETNSSFTYRISQGNIRKIRIIQNGEASNADVTAKIYKEGFLFRAGNVEEVALGKLNQTINEFAFDDSVQLLEITVTWTDKIPEISIIKTYSKGIGTVDKDELKAALEKEALDTWTTPSIEAFEAAKAVAQDVYQNSYATQDTVDSAAGTLKAAFDNAVVKGDMSALEKAFNEKKEESKDGVVIYTARSYAPYASVMNKIEEALKDKDAVSEKEVEELTQKLTAAESGLEYSLIEREVAETVLAADEGKYAEENYSAVTYKAYADAKAALAKIVEDDNAERKNPVEIAKLAAEYESAKAGLADIRELKALIDEIEAKELKEADYTKESWKNFSDALAEAKERLNDGTEETINAASEKLADAESALEPKTEDVDVLKVIEEMKKLDAANYTEDTYAALSEAITKAEQDAELGDTDLDKANIQKMNDVKDALVSVEALNNILADAEKYAAADYTKDSYAALEAALNAEKLAEVKKSGTKEEVAEAVEKIKEAIKTLVLNAKDLDSYRAGIELKEKGDFTEASYASYIQAYEALMALESGNTSINDFAAAKEAFEAAEAGLERQKADYTKVQEALKKVPADLSIYTDASVAELKKVLDSIDYNKYASEQDAVDAYAKAIEDAVNALKLKDDGGKDPGTPDKPGKPSDKPSDKPSGKPGNKDTAVKTGDTTNVFAAASVLMMSVMAMAYVLMRRRERR